MATETVDHQTRDSAVLSEQVVESADSSAIQPMFGGDLSDSDSDSESIHSIAAPPLVNERRTSEHERVTQNRRRRYLCYTHILFCL